MRNFFVFLSMGDFFVYGGLLCLRGTFFVCGELLRLCRHAKKALFFCQKAKKGKQKKGPDPGILPKTISPNQTLPHCRPRSWPGPRPISRYSRRTEPTPTSWPKAQLAVWARGRPAQGPTTRCEPESARPKAQPWARRGFRRESAPGPRPNSLGPLWGRACGVVRNLNQQNP